MNDGEVKGHLAEELPINFFEDMEPVAVNESTIERLTSLKNESTALAKQISQAAIDLAELQEKQVKIVRVSIPNIMEELNMKEFKMNDGSVVAIVDSVNASIKEENRPSAFRWLEEHDYDGIIKIKVVSEFGKGDGEDARKAQKAVQDAGFAASLDKAIHPATLKSFVKERLEAGETLPASFTVFEFKEAKIKEAKAPKAKK